MTQNLLITPDFDEAIDMGPVAAGKYNARIIGVEQKTAKSGNPYLNWRAELVGTEGGKQNGKLVFFMTMYTGKAANQIKDLWKAATGELPAAGQPWDPNTLLGREVSIAVATRYDNTGKESKYPDVDVIGPKDPTLTKGEATPF